MATCNTFDGTAKLAPIKATHSKLALIALYIDDREGLTVAPCYDGVWVVATAISEINAKLTADWCEAIHR